jgi:type IV pilus assembly protein PilE
MKSEKKMKLMGFTLIELVVVMVIVGILAIISVPVYRNYVQRGRASEGRHLLGSVAAAQRVYYAEYGTYIAIVTTRHDSTLGVDATQNTYFRTFACGVTGPQAYTSYTTGMAGSEANGINITLNQAVIGGPTITVVGGSSDGGT